MKPTISDQSRDQRSRSVVSQQVRPGALLTSGVGLVESPAVVIEELIDARIEPAESPFVRGQDLVDIEIANPAQRVEEIGQRVDRLLRVELRRSG